MLPYQIAALVVLVLLAAFFSAAEAALVSVSRLRARAMAERRLRGSQQLQLIVDDKSRFLTSMLVGNTIALLAADSLATYLALSLGIPSGAIGSTIVMSAVFLLFGEILPKTAATGDSERWALRLAAPISYVSYVVTPVARLFRNCARTFLRLFGIKHTHGAYVTEEDIRALVNVGAEQNVIEARARADPLGNGVRRHDPPRGDEAAAGGGRRLDRRLAEADPRRRHRRRLFEAPRLSGVQRRIVGVIHDRELLVALANGTLAHANVRALMRTAVHVPETKKIADLLREMHAKVFAGNRRLRVWRDGRTRDHGRSSGGDRRRDPRRARYRRAGAHRGAFHLEAVVEAGTNIEDVNAKLGTELPTEDFETIGGYTVGLFGRLPNEGEEIQADDHTRLRVERTRGRRILAVRIYSNGIAARAAKARIRTPPRSYKARGIVLRGRQLSEADRIVTLFTLERGKLDAVGKGVRRMRSHLAGRLELANECDFVMHRGRSLDVIVSAETLRAPWPSLVDPERFAVVSLVIETIDGFCEPDLPIPEVYELLAGAIAAVASAAEPRELLPRFALRLLEMLGLAPPLDRCVRCGAALPPGTVWLDAEAGGFIDERCRERWRDLSELKKAELDNLRALALPKGSGPRVRLRATPAGARAVEELVAHHLGRRPRRSRTSIASAPQAHSARDHGLGRRQQTHRGGGLGSQRQLRTAGDDDRADEPQTRPRGDRRAGRFISG